jgi:hypothetical protein
MEHYRPDSLTRCAAGCIDTTVWKDGDLLGERFAKRERKQFRGR